MAKFGYGKDYGLSIWCWSTRVKENISPSKFIGLNKWLVASYCNSYIYITVV